MKKSLYETDIYAKRAQKEGYRSRAVYKLMEIDQKFKLIHKNQAILELGAAPGSFSQYIVKKGAHVTGIDLLPVAPIEGAVFIVGDFRELSCHPRACPEDPDTTYKMVALDPLHSQRMTYDAVISDMAPNTTGIRHVDHDRSIGMLEEMIEYLPTFLKQDGYFVCKFFKGGTEHESIKKLKLMFKSVKLVKPEASRKESVECFLVCQFFRHLDNTPK